jgi:acyl-CoA dehydrogenase
MPLMRRQLLKLTLPTEQARTMVFQTAEALRRADAGDADAYPLMRILTPLIKFRACRDARKVTGDAMEIRGGCGYIEEWSDPRLVRDAHLGSIWEGTSNIVALDVLRAIAARARCPCCRHTCRRCLAIRRCTPLRAPRSTWPWPTPSRWRPVRQMPGPMATCWRVRPLPRCIT